MEFSLKFADYRSILIVIPGPREPATCVQAAGYPVTVLCLPTPVDCFRTLSNSLPLPRLLPACPQCTDVCQAVDQRHLMWSEYTAASDPKPLMRTNYRVPDWLPAADHQLPTLRVHTTADLLHPSHAFRHTTETVDG